MSNSNIKQRIDRLPHHKKSNKYTLPVFIKKENWNKLSKEEQEKIINQGLKPVFITKVVVRGR